MNTSQTATQTATQTARNLVEYSFYTSMNIQNTPPADVVLIPKNTCFYCKYHYDHTCGYDPNMINCTNCVKSINCTNCVKTDLSNDCIDCKNSTDCENCENCGNLAHCQNLTNCQRCMYCNGISNKKYHVFNREIPSSVYFQVRNCYKKQNVIFVLAGQLDHYDWLIREFVNLFQDDLRDRILGGIPVQNYNHKNCLFCLLADKHYITMKKDKVVFKQFVFEQPESQSGQPQPQQGVDWFSPDTEVDVTLYKDETNLPLAKEFGFEMKEF